MHSTRQRLGRFGRAVVQIAVPALLLAGAAVPAQPAAAAAASAGTTWADVMRRKLDTEAEAARLTTQLPALRATALSLGAKVTAVRQDETAAAESVAAATAADRTARARHVAAKSAAMAARKAVTAAKKQRPRNAGQVTASTRASTAADTAVRVRAAAILTTAATLKGALAVHASATGAVTEATAAHAAAAKVVSAAEGKIAALPKTRTVLAKQATAISEQVVTQARAGFTVAQTTQVYGVTVNKVVAFPFQRMIDDAAKAGVALSGGGFRTTQRQIELRKINGCPDVWTAPSSSCRVPTAIPGRSLHEVGLAVDITYGGRTINSRTSPAFKWLAANAGRYGFVNLPSEPWHWSITGR